MPVTGLRRRERRFESCRAQPSGFTAWPANKAPDQGYPARRLVWVSGRSRHQSGHLCRIRAERCNQVGDLATSQRRAWRLFGGEHGPLKEEAGGCMRERRSTGPGRRRVHRQDRRTVRRTAHRQHKIEWGLILSLRLWPNRALLLAGSVGSPGGLGSKRQGATPPHQSQPALVKVRTRSEWEREKVATLSC
jgi:hypothetical protein